MSGKSNLRSIKEFTTDRNTESGAVSIVHYNLDYRVIQCRPGIIIDRNREGYDHALRRVIRDAGNTS